MNLYGKTTHKKGLARFGFCCEIYILLFPNMNQLRCGPLARHRAQQNQLEWLLEILYGEKLISESNNTRFIRMTTKEMSFRIVFPQ